MPNLKDFFYSWIPTKILQNSANIAGKIWMMFTLSEGLDLTFALVLLGFSYNTIANKRLSIKVCQKTPHLFKWWVSSLEKEVIFILWSPLSYMGILGNYEVAFALSKEIISWNYNIQHCCSVLVQFSSETARCLI